MPAGSVWPTFKDYSHGFLGQINLTEIPAEVHRGPLPQSGLLLFFSVHGRPEYFEEPWKQEDEAQDGFTQVIYIPTDTPLERLQTPQDLTLLRACTIRFQSLLSLPVGYEWSRDPILTHFGWLEDEFERLSDLCYELLYVMRVPFGHQLLGYAASIQSAVTTLGECLLFDVQSDYDNAGMMWGDGGTIYFIISEDALQRADFSHVRADMQSG
jgi:uncharacterized protein YwqG